MDERAMSRCDARRKPSRRAVVSAGAAAAVLGGSGAAVLATPAEMNAAMRAELGTGPLRSGRVMLDIAGLVENGNSVPLVIQVESPMTMADHVASIHIFSPENPLPRISRFTLGPRCGRAEVRTTIRLATTQTVHVVAVMSDGSRWLATAEVEVTTAACFDQT